MQTDAQKLVVVRDQFALKGLSDDALRQILPAYREALQRLQFLLRTMPEGSVERQLWLRTQLATIEAQFRPVADRIYQVLPEAQARAFEEGLTNARKYLEAGGIQPEPALVENGFKMVADPIFVSPTNPRGLFISPSITRQQIVAAARETGFSVLSPGGSKVGLADLLPKWMAAQSDQVARHLRAGFLVGNSNDEIMREIGPLGPGRKGWAMTEAVVRTSMAEASQSAHDAFYEANADLLPKTKSGYRWWWDASNDTRLCPVCAPLDGIKFKERGEPPHAWPAHFSCRCKILPWTATQELLEEEDGPASGSFLEATPVQYDKRGKRLPPPAGYTGDNAYKRPMKIDGKQQWVRRRDLGPGQTTAGDMLQNANEHSKRMVLGKHTEAFNKLTGKGGKYEKNPQGAVRELLGNGLPPGSTAPRPTRGPKPKPPAPTPPPAPKPELTPAKKLEAEGRDLMNKVAPQLQANESIRRKAKTVLTARTNALINAATPEAKAAAATAYKRAAAILDRSEAKLDGAMGKVLDFMSQTSMSKTDIKATIDRVNFSGWGTNRAVNKELKQNMTDFIKMFNGSGFTATSNGHSWIKEVQPALDGRGWNKLGHTVAVRVGNRGNLFHELMHTVESQRPWMVDAAREWAAGRADTLEQANKLLKLRGMESSTKLGKPIYRLADIIPGSNYQNHEVAWNDDYLDPYMGKYYDQSNATEVWTMAAEMFGTGPKGMRALFAKHPDLFRMVVGLSRRN